MFFNAQLNLPDKSFIKEQSIKDYIKLLDKNNIDVVAKRYMDSGKSRDAAYAQAMYESGVIDQTEYNNVMKSIKW